MKTQMQYSGEYISAETGEEEPFSTNSVVEVGMKVRGMKDGDSIVINCSEEFTQ